MAKHLFGLIGNPVAHSLSPKYMHSKWEAEGVKDCAYHLFPVQQISEIERIIEQHPELCGLNVTSPYKEEVLAYANSIDSQVAILQSANLLCIIDGKISAYNTDTAGFAAIGLQKPLPKRALVLGSGGAAKAVCFVLKSKGIATETVSRKGPLDYAHLTSEQIADCQLIVNATPVGMGKLQQQAPPIPYQAITPNHTLIDLIYNPIETLFLKKGKKQGANTINGLQMFYAQADASWKIWKKELNIN